MHTLKVIFGGFLLLGGSMPASWAHDWRRSSDGDRHYDRVSAIRKLRVQAITSLLHSFGTILRPLPFLRLGRKHAQPAPFL